MVRPRPRGQVLWRSLPARTRAHRLIFFVSGRRTLRHVRLLGKPPRSNEFIRHVTNKFVTTWLVFIGSGRRSRHERLLRESITKKRRTRRKNRFLLFDYRNRGAAFCGCAKPRPSPRCAAL